MAFSIESLISDVTGSIQNLIPSLFGKNSTDSLYPISADKVGNVLNDINSIKANWNTLPLPYAFSVIDTSSTTALSALANQTNPFGEFALPLAPGKITQTEHPATKIQSTQGGTVVSHSGNKYKSLTISGTTGLSAFRGAGGVQKSTGEAIFQPNQMKYKSGFQVFMELRNYFKAYYQYKNTQRGAGGSSGLRLLWKNYKDGEFLIVELIDFQMDRVAPRSFLYDYNISLKVLGNLPVPKPPPLTLLQQLEKASEYMDTARGVFLRSQDILRQVESTYEATVLEPLRKASLAIKALQGIQTTAGDLSNQAIKNTVTALAALGILTNIKSKQSAAATGTSSNSVLDAIKLPNDLTAATANDPAGSIIALGAGLSLLSPTIFPQATQDVLAQEMTDVLTLPRTFFQDSYQNIVNVKNNAEDFFGLGSPEYDSIFNRISTIPVNASTIPTDAQFDLLNAFNLALLGIQSLLSTTTLYKSTFDQQIQELVTAFNGDISLEADTAVLQLILPVNTDLEQLALTYLNNTNRWPEIATLNQLAYPYIIQDISDTTHNVLHPGQTILIPKVPTFGFSNLPTGAEITSGPTLNALEASLGADLKVTDQFDLALGNDGDLQIVQSTANMAQAIVLKLGYEQGELKQHPTIGVGLSVGNKQVPLSQIQDDLVRSLLQDPRIDSISNLALTEISDSIQLSFDIKIKQVDIPIPVTVQL